MTYQNYEFTAFNESDFGVGDVNCGDTFTMPASATTCFNVSDNDAFLSGDCYDESADHYGQHAAIEGDNGEVGNGGQIYAEKYFWVSDQNGNWYVMIEIEQEGSGEDYYTFYTGGGYTVPAEGAVLTVGNSCNVGQNNTWLDMKCLDAGEKAEPVPTGAICGRLTEDADCDNTEFAADGGYDEGLGGQTVELYGWNGSSSYLVTTTTTNADGSYDFPELEGGWYYVQFPEIDGGEFAAKDVGVEHADSDANAWGRTDWICLEDGQVQLNIDASVKFPVETGSISGTVFCDTDCDGLQGQDVVIEGCDYTIEAEHMQKYGFHSVSGTEASNDCLVKLNCAGGWGDLTTTFGGKTGVYDVKIRVQDENDGQSIIKLKVDGQLVEAIRLDGDNNGEGSNNGGFSTYVIQDVSIENGESITLWADGDGYEFVRIDKIDLEGKDEVVSEAEPTKAGVEIKLIDADGTVIETTYTDADGNYAFNDVPVGNYTIMGVAPNGTEFTIQDAGSDDSIDSDVDANGMSGTVTVTADGNADVDLGVCEKPELGSIAGTYFCDENDNSVQDSGEAVLAGQTVWLIKAGSGVIASTTTDANGNYIFEDLEAGNYTVRFDGNNIGDKEFVEGNVGNDDTIDSDVVNVGGAGNGNTGTITLGQGENVTDVDAGVEVVDTGDAQISGRITFDADDDDTENAAGGGFDAGFGGKTVELLNEAGDVIATTTTAANGSYSFTGLDAGTYSVNFPDTMGLTIADKDVGAEGEDSDANANGQTDPIEVGIGDNIPNIDLSLQDPADASLGGRIFMDSDDDSQDNGNGNEAPAPGVTVRLLDADGNELATTTTDANGEYLFENLKAGDYKVDFPTEVDGKVLVDQNIGDDLSDSDADQGTGETGVVSVGISEDVRDVDAGVEDPGTAAINGRLFMDSDDDSQDNGEMGVSGVEVELLDDDGNVVATTTTDANGDYTFGGLGAGDYSVRFPTEVDGKVLVEQNVGPDATDSDADQGTGETGTISLEIGDVSNDNDAGIEDPAGSAIEGRVFMDNNDNSQDDNEMGVAGVEVTLLDEDGDVVTTTTTGADGSYSFGGLQAGTYSVTFPTTTDDGKVLVDSNVGPDETDSDADETTGNTGPITVGINETSSNNDAGVEDPGTAAIAGRYFCDENDDDVDNGEPGISGATVTLLDAAGNAVLDGNGNPVTTTTDGNGNYSFTGLAAGTYGVLFAADADGKTFVAQNDPNGNGNDTNDSDVDGNGVISTITVGIGETSDNNDAGVEDPGTAAIGDRVFLDENGNGQQDDGEAGVGGVGVIVRDADGNIVGTDTTDGNGDYLVGGLDAGTYTVEFEEVDGFDFTTANQGNDASDSDADQTTGVTGAVTLDIGETDLTVDAGLVVENTDPEAVNDEGMVCATEVVSIDVLANDSDADGDTVSVAHVNGVELNAGDSTTLDSGAVVTLNADGTLSYDSSTAVLGGVPAGEIVQGETATDSFTYSITDGNGGTATGTVDVTVKGDKDTIETILSSAPTSGTATFSGFTLGDAFTATLSGTGDARYDGMVIEAAYCLEYDADYLSGVDVTVDISGALDSLVTPSDFINGTAGNLDLINWIINQDFTSQDNGDGTGTNYTDAEIQGAIWGITDDNPFIAELPGNGTAANVQEILDLALANGEGFTPGEGDLFTLVLNPTEVQAGVSEADDFDQAFIVALPFDEYKEDCIC